jgi:hypothetical protein
MELENTMLNELNKEQKEKYHIFSHMQKLHLKNSNNSQNNNNSYYYYYLGVNLIEVHYMCI